MKYGWGVRYKKKTDWKEKNFQFDEEKARQFYNKLKKYDVKAVLFRYRLQTYIEQIKDIKFRWLGFEGEAKDISIILISIFAIIILWRFTK